MEPEDNPTTSDLIGFPKEEIKKQVNWVRLLLLITIPILTILKVSNHLAKGLRPTTFGIKKVPF
jgi:hypothetical protein